MLILLIQQQLASHQCMLCSLTLSLVYSILNSWISMELSVVCCLLSVVCCLLSVVCCQLSVICCLLSVVSCLLCCLTLSLVYSILNSWISMELCIFPYQHRGGPRPTLPQKGLTVYSVGHSLPSKRGLSFHRSFHHHHRSGYNHLWVGLMWGSV